MLDHGEPDKLPLPKQWPRHARAAVLNVISLAASAFVLHLETWANRLAPGARRLADRERLEAEIAMLKEEMRIKDARMAAIPARKRPHYRPADRMAVLEVKTARGWSNAETARRFGLEDPDTIARWMKRLHEQGKDALVRMPTPVNRFPDFVGYLVRRLKALCPTLGKVKISETLARSGLHIAPTTVHRLLKRDDPAPTEVAEASESEEADPKPERVVTAKRPNHVAHVDLTVIPTVLGGFSTMLSPNALPQVWPFCFRLAIAEDHFSRRAMGFRLFEKTPSSVQLRSFLAWVFHKAGAVPKYIISDKEKQFDCPGFRAWCDRRDVTPRYGAVGRHGSIAVIERLVRTVKNECTRRIPVPLRIEKMRAELGSYFRWYNGSRPSMALRGHTPHEAYFRRKPACEKPRYEPRPEYPREAWCASPQTKVKGRRGVRLRLEVLPFEGRKYLPVIQLRPAA